MSELILLAAGGLCREVLTTLAAGTPYEVVGIHDDSPRLRDSTVSGVPVLGPIVAAVDHSNASFLVCAGSGETRRRIVERLAGLGVQRDRFATVIDPTVRIPPTCSVGSGTIILSQCALTSDVVIGDHVVVMPNVTLTHDDRVDDFATLCAGVTLGGSVHVGEGAYLGMNSAVRERITMGARSVLGMGAALVADLPDHETWVGVPARPWGASR